MIEFQITDIVFHDQAFHVKSLAFVCGAPAKTFVNAIKGHSGYFEWGCFCFASQPQEAVNKEVIPLTQLNGFHLVPLDYMHLICLGDEVAIELDSSICCEGEASSSDNSTSAGCTPGTTSL